ncbi:unnamed protein product [Microthlaspi erraticum]|uniref:glutathione transferase n=1 Tax=Microthlaspi erraticum TaxID=1685480 RepID=A0A6D2JP20_9BRAS|nr:unnamed protein product [Microthlaspi erraticum]
MAGIKVFGHAASTSTRKVLLALYEKNLDFELVHVDILAVSTRRSLSSHATIKSDYSVHSSRYAEEGTNLLPADPKNTADYATMANGMEVEAHHFDPPATKLAYEHVFKLMYGLTTDDAVVAEEEAKLAKVLDIYEGRLGAFKYCAGDTFTLTDLHHIPVIQYLLQTPSKKLFTERPHLNAWVTDITSRPASLKVLQ